MRQKYMFLAITIDEVNNQEVLYHNAIGQSTAQMAYEVKCEQVIDLSKLEVGKSYYIEVEDIGDRRQCYVWTTATRLSKQKVGLLYSAHLRNGKERKYEPLPIELKYAIMRWAIDGWKGWLIAKDFAEGRDPSANEVLIATVKQPDVKEKTLNDIEAIMIAFRANELLEF